MAILASLIRAAMHRTPSTASPAGVHDSSATDTADNFVTAGGVYTPSTESLVYANDAEHVRIVAPRGWERFDSKDAMMALRTDGCASQLMENRSGSERDLLNTLVFNNLKADHPGLTRSDAKASLGGRDATLMTMNYVRDSEPELMRYYVVGGSDERQWILVENVASPSGAPQPCEAGLTQIRSGLHF